MKPPWITLAVLMGLSPTWCLAQGSREGLFETRVRPLLAQRCYECHRRLAENEVSVHDLQATILHLLGIDLERLTFGHAGRDYRLTDVHGRVVQPIIA